MSAQDKRDSVDAGTGTELEDLLALWRRHVELDLRVCMPGHVTAYNPTTQRATIQLGLLPVRFVEDVPTPQGPIVLPNVPVLNIGGSLGYVSFQLVPGDSGIVVFSDRCMAEWLKLGEPVDPVNYRTHALGDGVFIPGVRATPDVITPPTDLTGTVVEGPLVSVGRLATQFALRGTSLAATATSLAATLAAIPNAVEPTAPSAATLANANKAAILALLAEIIAQVSTKVRIE